MKKIKVAPKVKKSLKSAPSKLSKYYLGLGVLVVAAASVYLLYKSMVQTTSIDVITSTSSMDRGACGSVKTFSLTNSCGPDMFNTVVFTCTNSSVTHKLGLATSSSKAPDTCVSPVDYYNQARSVCSAPCPMPPSPTSTPVPSNCTYETVKCVKAPCPKQLVCTSPTPSASATPTQICGQVDGFCLDKSKACVEYHDTCQMKSLCGYVPFTTCGSSVHSPTPKEIPVPTR